MNKKNTQALRVLNYMTGYGFITRLSAMEDIGVANLTAVISDLRKAGYKIKTVRVETVNRYHEKVSYARYFLEEAE